MTYSQKWFFFNLICCCLSITMLLAKYNHQITELKTENEVLESIVNDSVYLNNCPLCHSKDVELTSNAWGYEIRCTNCDAHTVFYNTAHEAITYWNSLNLGDTTHEK